jgi:3-carboxy-cis,cis-muconate cycloisomerase
MVHQALAAELQLNPATIAWYSARDSFAELVSLCGMLTATLGKMGREVARLEKTEFGEVEEPFVSGKGSSSTIPQKRNAILSEAVIGIAHLASQQVPTMLQAMKPEHERAMGEWHIEWGAIPHVCQLTGTAQSHALEIFAGLVVHPEAMQRDLALSKGQIVAEVGGVFKVTPGLLEEFGPDRVRDTPISEQAIIGSALGAAITGLRP